MISMNPENGHQQDNITETLTTYVQMIQLLQLLTNL